jgi:hypothetical protein
LTPLADAKVFNQPEMCRISFPGDIGRRTLVVRTNCVNGGCW